MTEERANFTRRFYSTDQVVFIPNEPEIREHFHDIPVIEAREVRHAVKQSKKGNLLDNVAVDLYSKLVNLRNECLKLPEESNEVITNLFSKKGGPKRNQLLTYQFSQHSLQTIYENNYKQNS